MAPKLFLGAVCFSLLAVGAAGCSSSGSPAFGPNAGPAQSVTSGNRHSGSSSKIKHVVIIIQENRSFVNLFSGFPGADAPKVGYEHDGTKVTLSQMSFKGLGLNHGFNTSVVDWDNGKMDGFDLSSPSSPKFPYSYLTRSDVTPYWTMAKSYVLADRMFPTQFGGSFSAHLNLIAGTDKISPTVAITDYASMDPWGCDAPNGTKSFIVNSSRQVSKKGPFPCFTQFKTMADTLDAAGVSWKYYAPQTIDCSDECDGGGLEWSSFDAISNVRYGPDWQRNVINPQTAILNDAPNGTMASVSWVVPDLKDSDHPGTNSDTGPSWVAAVVNAIGKSQYWDSTAIVVVWDDWGGWYDDAPPPQLDFLGLGIRVGCVIISPYAKAHTVSHTQYEYGSILKFIEETFGLASLGYSDARATSISDSFDFTQAPIPFKHIKAKYPAKHFLLERPSFRPPDDE
ncbi:MAG: alkaline phosphatase family protein [Candidatus Tumulicola sp.]